jgi:hypothetical protein
LDISKWGNSIHIRTLDATTKTTQIMQAEIDFLHKAENNADSLANLELQAPKFNKQCSQVLNILLSGERLTSWTAMVKYHIGHLPRRILDLKEKGIAIQDEWVEENGSRFKQYFLTKQ